MKVTLISSTFARRTSGYGDVLQMTRLEKGLREIGVDATFIPMVGKTGTPVSCEHSDNCSGVCLDCPHAEAQKYGAVDRLVKIALKTDADVYHVRGFDVLNRMPEGLRVVYTGFPYARASSQISEEADKKLMQKASAVVALNKGMQSYLTERYGLNVDLAPVAADTDVFTPIHVDEPGLDEIRAMRVGYVGAYQNYQGLRMLLETISTLTNLGTPVLLTACINRKTSADEMRAFCDLIGISHLVTIHDTVSNEQIPSLIKDCDVMHLVRDFDTTLSMTPIKLLDYMAMNKPIVYSVGDKGITEMWEDKSCEVGESIGEFLRTYRFCNNKPPRTFGMREKLFEEKRDHVGAAKLAEKVYRGVL